MIKRADGFIPKVLRRTATLILTLAVAAAAGAAVLAGHALLSASATEPGPAAPLTSVRVIEVRPTHDHAVTRRFTGQIEAAARVDLGFELGGRLAELLVAEGDVVAQGAVLARLDTSALIPERAALEAELAALQADAELARLTLARQDALTERGFRAVAAQDEARLGLARIEAGMAATAARIAGVDVRLEKSILRAPFAARIGARQIDAGQTVAAGQPVLVLFEAGPARARVGLPPDLAATLQPGDPVALELGGVVRAATVLHLRPDLDPLTRSRPVVLTLQEAAPVLGETVSVILEQRIQTPGFWAPLAALRDGAQGSWSVMALRPAPEGDRVQPAAVEVIHGEGARVFLRGDLPPGARIVAEAPDRVAPGQLVLDQLARAEE
ncbi:efflux RND transporter periplasmic adaptor subunit [Paracoccus sp. (in: a-proteobacteria)]|uniref:efflux RND transporter periplasmic adaptor subunit n=1 Tax=Paracoccus sp. TaxID=267 RepID=UPI00272C54D0|nr:efflux RND transporter periplasmic adaptor subunit [Paracoccus sp. (in: a-proteobacteria)]